MKFFVSLILIALLSFAACLLLPWWSIAVVAFLVTALIPLKPVTAFFSGFTAIFILWFSLSAFISSANDHVLAHKVSVLILKMDNVWMLMLTTALIGGLVAGFAALTGSFVRRKQN
ncbi:MAG: hypothetical protein EOP53_10300 [Sphingobacteriales bacterium]|nr:MAG: hypothetical protein EOP53_10300 [Sphingobacteriales bacterium]